MPVVYCSNNCGNSSPESAFEHGHTAVGSTMHVLGQWLENGLAPGNGHHNSTWALGV